MRRCNFTLLACLLVVVLAPACSKNGTSDEQPVYTGDSVNDIAGAVQAGDAGMVSKLIDADASLLELRDGQGQTLLHMAVLYNQPKIVKLLIDKGMDPNVRDQAEMTPLAALDNSGFRAPEARKVLLQLGGKT